MENDKLIHKRMNDINTFQAHENEVYLRGTDEYGKDFQVCFDSYNFLEWIDKAESNGAFISRTSFIHSRLKLDSNEIQGFAIADNFAPFVFITSLSILYP